LKKVEKSSILLLNRINTSTLVVSRLIMRHTVVKSQHVDVQYINTHKLDAF